MKDIYEVKDNQSLSFNHVCCRGVPARAGSVPQWTGSWEGPEHAHNSTILFSPFSKKFPLEANANNTAQQHNDVNQLPALVEQVHLFTINLSHTDSLSSSQTVSAIPPGSSSSLADWTGLESPNGGKGQYERGHTLTPHLRAMHSSRKPDLSSKQLVHTCIAHGRLGTPSRRIRVISGIRSYLWGPDCAGALQFGGWGLLCFICACGINLDVVHPKWYVSKMSPSASRGGGESSIFSRGMKLKCLLRWDLLKWLDI